MTQEKKHKIISAAVSVVIHLILIVILSFLTLEYMPKNDEDDGVPVMLGDLSDAAGDSAGEQIASNDVEDETDAVDASSLPEPEPTPAVPEPEPEPAPAEEALMTQKTEPSVNVAEERRKEEEAERKRQEELRKEEERRKAEEARIAEERRKAEEAERKRKEEEERKRRAAADRAQNLMTGAFGNTKTNGNNGQTQGDGLQGSPDGNANRGATTGVGGTGDNPIAKVGSRTPLNIPRPNYVDKQASGKVVVEITVSRSGKVISARIDPTKTTATKALAEEAKAKALMSTFSVGTDDAEVGTITYNFRLR